jgi:hypothetical protein
MRCLPEINYLTVYCLLFILCSVNRSDVKLFYIYINQFAFFLPNLEKNLKNFAKTAVFQLGNFSTHHM